MEGSSESLLSVNGQPQCDSHGGETTPLLAGKNGFLVCPEIYVQ